MTRLASRRNDMDHSHGHKRSIRRGVVRWLMAALALAVLDARAADATGSFLMPRISEARADFEAGLLVIRGQNLVRTTTDDVGVFLSGEPLSIVSKTPQELVAQLPA